MNNEIPILIAQGMVMIAFLVIGARVTVRTHSISKGGLVTYGLLVLWAILFCFALPMAVTSITKDPGVMYGLFPDLRGLVAMSITGWIPAFVFVAIVRGIQTIFVKIRESRK